MKNTILILSLLSLLAGCKKEAAILTPINPGGSTTKFEEYTIYEGDQYCDKNFLKAVDLAELRFAVKFDSTAVYATREAENQFDINKLYGFSDNNSDHHSFSARFGWRWSGGALRLFAYIYNNDVRSFRELGTVSIGSENFCSIKVDSGSYIFTLNNKSDTLPRKSATLRGRGYKLYPYFGGSEAAPHDIHVWIRELE